MIKRFHRVLYLVVLTPCFIAKGQNDFRAVVEKIGVSAPPFSISQDMVVKNKIRLSPITSSFIQFACYKVVETPSFIGVVLQQNDTLRNPKTLFYHFSTFTKEGLPISSIRLAGTIGDRQIYATISSENAISVYSKWQIALKSTTNALSIQLTNKKDFFIQSSGEIERRYPSFKSLLSELTTLYLPDKIDKKWEEELAMTSFSYPIIAISQPSAVLLQFDTVKGVYDICGKIKLSDKFYTLLVLGEEYGKDPDSWLLRSYRNYYLKTFTKEGKVIDQLKVLSFIADDQYTLLQTDIKNNLMTQFGFTKDQTVISTYKLKSDGRFERTDKKNK